MLDKVNFLPSSQLFNCLFGMLSVYTIYALVYERLLMHPYYNNMTGETEFQYCAAVLLFWEQIFAWAFAQIVSEAKLTTRQVKNPEHQIPWKMSGLFGAIKFVALALFVEGVYQTNFRFAIMVKTGLFIAHSVLSGIYSKIYGKSCTSTKIVEIICASLVLGGAILFWIYDPEICFYVPIQPRVIGSVMLMASVIVEAILAIVKQDYVEKSKKNPLRLQRDMVSWIVPFSYFYMISKGSFSDDFKYAFRHLEYMVEAAIVGLLYYMAQYIEIKASQTLNPTSSGYLASAGMLLILQISYTISVHKYDWNQILGLVAAWLGVAGGLWVLGPNEKHERVVENMSFKPYQKVCDLENDQ